MHDRLTLKYSFLAIAKSVRGRTGSFKSRTSFTLVKKSRPMKISDYQKKSTIIPETLFVCPIPEY